MPKQSKIQNPKSKIVTATRDDLAALRELLGRANDAPYDLGAVAEEKCFAPGVAGAPVVRVAEVADRLVGVAVTCGRTLRILAVDRAHRRRGFGSALLADAESRGARVIAAEAGNYFTPGIVDSDIETLRFFDARGYIESRSTHNLHVELDGDEAPEEPRRVVEGPRRTIKGPLRATHADRERVLDFIEREFGRIWRFEVSRGFDRNDPTVFIVEDHAGIAGFAAHDVNNRGLGWFGPTGVAKAMRNRGLGRQLLLASLADLRRLGYSRAIIAWTEAVAFYRKACGAQPAHRFITLERRE